MKSDDMSVEDMEDLFRELYSEKFGGSLEELKEKPSNPGELNPGLERCTLMGTNRDNNIEIRFQDTPECMDAEEEYREILRAALGGAETVYKTLK